MDQNCDGARTTVQPCASASCASGGTQLCDDRTGEPIGACVEDNACTCPAGGCAYCALTYKNTSDQSKKAPCTPAVGKLKFPACVEGAACTIDVLSATPPWVGYLSTQPTSGFTTRIQNVISGDAYVELKLANVTDVPAQPSIGTLNLMITQAGQSRLLPVDIQLTDTNPVPMCQVISGTSMHAMTCGP